MVFDSAEADCGWALGSWKLAGCVRSVYGWLVLIAC